jgi:hypothetical protein
MLNNDRTMRLIVRSCNRSNGSLLSVLIGSLSDASTREGRGTREARDARGAGRELCISVKSHR